MTFIKQINIIEERKAVFSKGASAGNDIIDTIFVIIFGIVFGTMPSSITNNQTKKLLMDIYNEKIGDLKERGYFQNVYSIFRTKFNVRHNSSKKTDIDFDLNELKKPIMDAIDSQTLIQMKKNFDYSTSGWNFFSNRFFNLQIFKNANYRKFYLTLDLWQEDEKNKTIKLDNEKLKKFNKLLKYLNDHVTNDANSEDFKNGNKFIFSVKFNKYFDEMATDIDNIVIHYNIYANNPNSNKIEKFLSNLKTNNNFKDIIADRSTNNSASIIIDGEEFKIKRTSFGRDMTLKDPSDHTKIEHQSDSAIKARIIDFWLRVIFVNIGDKSKDVTKFNVKDIFLNTPQGKTNDLFDSLESPNNKTKIKKETITNKLLDIKNNFLTIIMNIYNSKEIQDTIEEFNNNQNVNANTVLAKFYNLKHQIKENYKSQILKEIVKITNLSTDALNTYNDIIE